MQPTPTESLRQTLDQAQSEARGLNQDFVGTDHLLLALLHGESTHAVRALRREHVKLDALGASLLKQMNRADLSPVVSGNLPLSPKAQRAFNASIAMAQSLRETKVSTRHLLLSLINEPAAALTAALQRCGADPETLAKALAQKPTEDEA